MGVPVIGANIGGIPEIIEEGKTGFLFESGDVNSLVNAIEQSLTLGEDDYQELKKLARDFAKEHFDSERYKEKLIGFYKEVIESMNS